MDAVSNLIATYKLLLRAHIESSVFHVVQDIAGSTASSDLKKEASESMEQVYEIFEQSRVLLSTDPQPVGSTRQLSMHTYGVASPRGEAIAKRCDTAVQELTKCIERSSCLSLSTVTVVDDGLRVVQEELANHAKIIADKLMKPAFSENELERQLHNVQNLLDSPVVHDIRSSAILFGFRVTDKHQSRRECESGRRA